MSSFTLLPYINPPAHAIDITTAVANVNLVDNNFQVSQTMAGIVNSANLSVAGTSQFTGVATFSQQPVFSAGITVPSEIDLGALTVSGLTSANGGLTVLGAVSLPSSSIVQSAVSSGYVDLANVQTIAGVKTFSSPPVHSGAGLTSNTVPALAIVNKSLGDAQITLAGIGQTSLVNGYVDLSSAQTVAGIKTFSSPPVHSGAGITSNTVPALAIVNDSLGDAQISTGGVGQTSVASGYVDLANAQTVAGVKTFSSPPVHSGAGLTSASVPDSALTSNIPRLNAALNTFTTDLTVNGVFRCASEIDSGALTCSSAVVSGFNGLTVSGASGLTVSSGITTLSAGIVIPTVQINLAIISGAVTINLNNLSFNEAVLLSANFTANITSFVFVNAIVNAEFNIYIQGGASNRNVSKNLGTGQVNNLSGNTQIGAGSTWICRGKVLTSTLVALEFINFT